jgi:hypothetical protein
MQGRIIIACVLDAKRRQQNGRGHQQLHFRVVGALIACDQLRANRVAVPIENEILLAVRRARNAPLKGRRQIQ